MWRSADCEYVSTGPGWTLDDLKDWLEIEGNDQDDAVIRAMKVTMAM